MANNKQIASDVLEAMGGAENVTSVAHCMTRLRFTLKDPDLPDAKAVQAIDGVIGTQVSGGQFQVIIGQNVPKVYDEVLKLGSFERQAAIDENLDDAPKEKLTAWGWVKKVCNGALNYMSGSMIQLIPILVVCSMFGMVRSVLGPSILGVITAESDLYILMDFAYDAGFYYIPLYLGYAAAKKLNVSPMLGLLMAGILIAPDFQALAGTSFSVYGIPTTAYDYSSTVLPILLSVWVMMYVEKFFKRVVPDMLSTIFTPTLTMAVMLPISLCLLAPLGNYCGQLFSDLMFFLDDTIGILAVPIYSAVQIYTVLTGMHLVIAGFNVAVFAENGYLYGIFIAGIWAATALWGVEFGAFLRLRDKKEKALAFEYFIANIIGGVSEPALYGMCFKYRKTFIGYMIGAAVGGLYAAIFGVKNYVMGGMNIFMLSRFAGGEGYYNLIHGVIACTIGFVVSCVITYFFCFSEEELENGPITQEA